MSVLYQLSNFQTFKLLQNRHILNGHNYESITRTVKKTIHEIAHTWNTILHDYIRRYIPVYLHVFELSSTQFKIWVLHDARFFSILQQILKLIILSFKFWGGLPKAETSDFIAFEYAIGSLLYFSTLIANMTQIADEVILNVKCP